MLALAAPLAAGLGGAGATAAGTGFGAAMMGGLGSAVGDMLGASIGGLFSASSARDQMRFQERMANTQYQRAAKDLEAAGLNRVLALGSGAHSPAGASYQMEAPKLGAAFAQGASSAQSVVESKARLPLIGAQADAALASARAAESEAKLRDATAKKMLDMLPYEMTESGGRIRAQQDTHEMFNLDKRTKELEIPRLEVLRSLYTEFGPVVLDFVKWLKEKFNSAKEVEVDLPKMINKAVGAVGGSPTDSDGNIIVDPEDKEYMQALFNQFQKDYGPGGKYYKGGK